MSTKKTANIVSSSYPLPWPCSTPVSVSEQEQRRGIRLEAQLLILHTQRDL